MSLVLGAYIVGAPHQPELIDDYTSLVGAMPRLVMWFQNWDQEFDPALADSIVSRGAAPMLTWEPWGRSLVDIAAGVYDAYIQAWAARVGAWGKPLYLRPAHEMNGDWYPWGAGNDAADYIAAWRHVHGIFQNAGAGNVKWVWSPNNGGSKPMKTFYPGDEYVDYTALDGYNWGPTQSWGSHWESLLQLFSDGYYAIQALTNKPMMIAETSSTEIGGDKAAWILRSLLHEIPHYFPAVRAVVWFHENKEQDWRVDSSPEALESFRMAAASPVYTGSL